MGDAKFTRAHMAMGSFEVAFRPLPHLVAKFVPFRHIVFYLGQSRKFCGVVTEIDRSDEHQIVLRGPGPEWWLGEDERNGPVRDPKTYTNQRSDQIAADLLLRNDGTRALNAGQLIVGNIVPSFAINYETCRWALLRLVAMTRTEYRINPDFTFDWAGNGNLFQTRNLVLTEAGGTAASVHYSPSTYNTASRVVTLGTGTGNNIIAQSATTALDPSWRDWNNAPYQRDRVVDAPAASDTGQVSAIAGAAVTNQALAGKEAKVVLSRLALLNQFDIGDTVYIHRDRVLEDVTAAIVYEGEIYPAVAMRIAEYTVTVGPEWRVVLRNPDGSEEDLTDLAILRPASSVEVRLVSNPEAFFAAIQSTSANQISQRTTPQTLATGSVTSDSIAVGAVSAQDIAAGAVNGPNVSFGNFDNLYDDPGFELGTGSQTFTGFARVRDVTNARNGSWVARAVGDNSSTMSVRQAAYVEARPGDIFYTECFVKKGDASTTGTATLYLEWLDAAKNQISRWAVASTTGSTTYTQLSGASQPPNSAPAGTCYVRVAVEVTPFTGTWYLDDVYLHKSVISAYIADGAIITAKIADAQITTAKIVDAAITNAKISDLAADKITVGNLLATMTITTGLLRTAASGSRVELNNSGLILYTSSRAGWFEGSESIRWGNASGGALFAGFWGYFDSDTAPYVQFLMSAVRRTNDVGHEDRVMWEILDSTGGNTIAEANLRTPSDDGSTRSVLFEIWGNKNGYAFATTDGISGSNEIYYAHIGAWAKTALTGAVALTDVPTFQSGTHFSTGNVAAGSSASANITYGATVSNNRTVPHVSVGHEDDVTNPSWSVFCDSRSRSGCTAKAKNIGTATGSTVVTLLPWAEN